MRVTGLMPIKGIGRKQETLDLIPRLFHAAGRLQGDTFDLVVIADEDEELADAVVGLNMPRVHLIRNQVRKGYWASLTIGAKATDAPLLVNLANDILPAREWLSRGLKVYERAKRELGKEPIIGFNDGVHPATHAGHCLFPRVVLENWYGANLFPDAYDHLYADTEIVMRAMQEKRWAYSIFAQLFHNHIVNGKPHDPVYALGHAKETQDHATFQRRMANGWQ